MPDAGHDPDPLPSTSHTEIQFTIIIPFYFWSSMWLFPLKFCKICLLQQVTYWATPNLQEFVL
jgi:hypothetical protein